MSLIRLNNWIVLSLLPMALQAADPARSYGEEGTRFRVGVVVLSGATVPEPDGLWKLLRVRQGTLCCRADLEADVSTIRDCFGYSGRLVAVRPCVEDCGAGACVVRYEVKESPPARLGQFRLAAEGTPHRQRAPKRSPPAPAMNQEPATGYSLPDVWPAPSPLVQAETVMRRYYYRFQGVVEPVFAFRLRDTEWWRTSLLVRPMSLTYASDVYLGRGVVAGVQLEAGKDGAAAPLTLTWFAMEGMGVSLGFDVLRWRLVPAIELYP